MELNEEEKRKLFQVGGDWSKTGWEKRPYCKGMAEAQQSEGVERKYVTLDDPDVRYLAKRDPALFIQRYSPPVLNDEIQYATELLPYIK